MFLNMIHKSKWYVNESFCNKLERGERTDGWPGVITIFYGRVNVEPLFSNPEATINNFEWNSVNNSNGNNNKNKNK